MYRLLLEASHIIRTNGTKRKIEKLIQWGKRRPDIPKETFQTRGRLPQRENTPNDLKTNKILRKEQKLKTVKLILKETSPEKTQLS